MLKSCVLLTKHFTKMINRGLTKMNLDLEVNRLVWIDLEMTGLDVNTDTIMEVACVVTDADLNVIAEGPNLIIHTPEEKLKEMNEWCLAQHSKSGLTEASRCSTIKIEDAENILMEYLQKHVTKKCSPLAGNSVYMDRLFLYKYMPTLNEYLHYRIIDTSTIKELCKRWNGEVFKVTPKKTYTHRALGDILESIEELKYYKKEFLRCN